MFPLKHNNILTQYYIFYNIKNDKLEVGDIYGNRFLTNDLQNNMLNGHYRVFYTELKYILKEKVHIYFINDINNTNNTFKEYLVSKFNKNELIEQFTTKFKENNIELNEYD